MSPDGVRLPRSSYVRVASLAAVTLIPLAFWVVAAAPGNVTLRRGGAGVAWSFLSRAFSPALEYERRTTGGKSLISNALAAAEKTVTFAAAAMSVALIGGIVLAFCASSAWWSGELGARRGWRVATVGGPALYGVTRVFIALLRSIHELLWAVMLLAALGLGHLTAILAIAIPYSGILAKVFSEMIDEAPRAPAQALRDAGASPLQAFCFGLIPRALPDMAAYALYRFECALRSAAILGFFGFPTLGYFISASFENLQYGEVWTYLYVLFALVAATDWWSGALRRRFVA
jgi:ABC-type phosphate/phosphonate transport system permease subunit